MGWLAALSLTAALAAGEAVPVKDAPAEGKEKLSATNLPGKYGFVDIEGKQVIPCQWDYAQEFRHGMARVQKGEKYGFINVKGEIVVPCVWDDVGAFYGSGDRTEVEKGGKWGAIDGSGKLVVSCLWDSIGDFSDKLTMVKDGDLIGFIDFDGVVLQAPQWTEMNRYRGCDAVSVEKDGKWGIVGSDGKLVSAPRWDSVSVYEGKMFKVEEKTEAGSKYSLLDAGGKVIVADLDEVEVYSYPSRYDYFNPFGGAYTPPSILQIRKGSKWGYVSIEGKLISDVQWDAPAKFSDGYAEVRAGGLHSVLGEDGKTWPFPGYLIDGVSDGLVRVKDKATGKMGFLGMDGKPVIPCVWDDCSGLSPDDRSIVKRDGKYGLIDKAGNLLCAPVWDDIESCAVEDRWVVCRGELYGFADRNGNLMGELKWDKIWSEDEYLAGSKGDSFSVLDRKGEIVATHPWTIKSEESWGYLVESAGKYGFVNRAGKVVAVPKWDEITASYDADYLTVRLGDKWGIIDQSGVVVADAVWDKVEEFQVEGKRRKSGAFFVRREGKWGTLSRTGKVLQKPRWDDFSWCIGGNGYCDPDPEKTARTNTNFGYVVRQGKSSGYVDESGIMTIPPTLDELYFLGDLGYGKVKGLHGIYHKSGKVISAPQWQEYFEYEEGMAAVRMPEEGGMKEENSGCRPD